MTGSDGRLTTHFNDQQLQVLSVWRVSRATDQLTAVARLSCATSFTKLFDPRPREQQNAKFSESYIYSELQGKLYYTYLQRKITQIAFLFYFCVATAQLGPGPLPCWRFYITHSQRDSPERGISSSQRPLPTQHNKHKRRTPMPSAGLEPAIPSIARQQTRALDRTATGIGQK